MDNKIYGCEWQDTQICVYSIHNIFKINYRYSVYLQIQKYIIKSFTLRSIDQLLDLTDLLNQLRCGRYTKLVQIKQKKIAITLINKY